MNLFNIKTTGYSSVNFLQESILPKFTSQQMKATGVALAIIAGLALCFALCIYLAKRTFKCFSSKDDKPSIVKNNGETPNAEKPKTVTPNAETPNAETPKIEDAKPVKKITKVLDPTTPFEITLTNRGQKKVCSVTGNMTVEGLKKEAIKILEFSADADISLHDEEKLENGTLADCGVSEGCDIYVHHILPPGYVD